jgi:RNA polymerase sigma-70 factor (ECF subfamily)
MSFELPRAPMESIRDGKALDKATLEQLYVKLEKPMFNVVYRWLWNAGDAQDVVQEAFLKIWNVRDDVDLATVDSLLYRTALNLASNRRRSSRLWRWIGLEAASDEASPAPSSEEALASAQARQRVRAAIEALPERLRQVILLSEYSELTHQEIGAALGIPSGTVGSRRNAAITQLSQQLGEIDGLT